MLLVIALTLQVFPGTTARIAKAGGEDLLIATSLKVELDKLGKGNAQESTLFRFNTPEMTFHNMSQSTVESNVRNYLVSDGHDATDVSVLLKQASDTTCEIETNYSLENFSACTNGVWSIKGNTDILKDLKQVTDNAVSSPLALHITSDYSYLLPSGSYVMYPLDDAHFHRVYGNSIFDIARSETPFGDGTKVDITCDYFIARNDLVSLDWFNDFSNLLEVQYRCAEPVDLSLSPKVDSKDVGEDSVQSAATATLQNDSLRAYISGDGDFQLYKSDGTALLYPSYTSNFTLQIDGANYSITQSPYLDSYIYSPLTVVDATHAYITYGFFGNKLQVKHEFILSDKSLEFRVTCDNSDSVSHSVKARYLLDTQLGPNDGAPLAYAGNVRTFETEVPSLSSVWSASDTDPSIQPASITAFGTMGYPSWYRLVFAYWPHAYRSIFDYTPDPNQRFYTPGYTSSPSSDSCVLEYFDLGGVAPGTCSAIPLTTYYGLSSPTTESDALRNEVLALANNLKSGILDDGDSSIKSYLRSFYWTYKGVGSLDSLINEDIAKYGIEFLLQTTKKAAESIDPAKLAISLLASVVNGFRTEVAIEIFVNSIGLLYGKLAPIATTSTTEDSFVTRVMANQDGALQSLENLFKVGDAIAGIDTKKTDFETNFQSLVASYNQLSEAQKTELYHKIHEMNNALSISYDREYANGLRLLMLPTGMTPLAVKAQDYAYRGIRKLYDVLQESDNWGWVLFATSGVLTVLAIVATGGAAAAIIPILGWVATGESLGFTRVAITKKDALVMNHSSAVLELTGEMGGKDTASPDLSGRRYYVLSKTVDWTTANITNYQLDKINGVVTDYRISEQIDTSIFNNHGTVSFTVTNTGTIPCVISATTYISDQQQCSAIDPLQGSIGRLALVYPELDAVINPNQTKTVPKTFTLFPGYFSNGAKPYYAYTLVYLGSKLVYMSPASTIYVGTSSQTSQSQVNSSVLISNQPISQGSSISQNVTTGSSAGEARFIAFYPGSQMDLHLYDSQGRHVGLNYQTGNLDLGIPGAKYSGLGTNPQWISVPNSTSTSYVVKVVGSDLIDPEPVTVVKEEIPVRPPLLYSFPESMDISQDKGTAQDYLVSIGEAGGSQDIGNVTITATGSVAPWISFNNTSYANIPAGSSISVKVTVSVPSDIPDGTYTGSVTVSSSNAGTVTIPISATPAGYTLTVNITGSGSVSKSPNQASYSPGTVVTLTATPAAGCTFTGWSGDLAGTANPTTITMDADKTVTAAFTSSTTNLGDANGDGIVNTLDVLLAARAATGLGAPLTGSAFLAADVNHDGIMNALDVLLIARLAVGLPV